MYDYTDVEARARLWELVSATRFAMVTTHDRRGLLRSRPLTTRNGDQYQDTALYFLVAASGALVDDVTADARVHVGYADADKDRYVSISGHARVLRDPELARRLWTASASTWFSGGVDDADLRVLQVHMESAEYWDVRASKVVQMLKKAGAALRGRTRSVRSEHRRVSLPP
jgi:general stress protein 26